ncbi:LGFP repeat-containing protein [Acaricomes phytoseiuli]|uniref:LGFP repeat-containing protein n=1 Tax=Acaricomes phytoseiuli TaxID=291968 RepID=UPI003CCBAEB8
MRAEWANQNYENGRLGYPTSDEIYPAPGEAYQTYEGGTIFYKAGQGTRIQYK